MRLIAKILLLTLSALWSMACGGGGLATDAGTDAGADGSDGGSDIDVSGYTCVKDPALLDVHIDCRQDVECPCGSHCDRGLCVHECLADLDCAGWCDYFGRCRDADDTESIPGARPPAASQMLVRPGYIPVFDWEGDKLRTVTISAPLRDLSQVRLVASQGLSVNCSDHYARECTLPLVPVGTTTEVELRIEQVPGNPRAAWRLNVMFGQQLEVVGLRREAAAYLTPVEPGIYEGQIWLQDAAAVLETDQPFASAALGAQFHLLNVPLTAEVYPDGTLVLSDPAGVLPQDWVFALQADGSFDALVGGDDRSSRIYLGGAEAADETTTELSVAASGSMSSIGGGLHGTLQMEVSGLGLTYAPAMLVDERHRVRWEFVLARSADIPVAQQPPAIGSGETARRMRATWQKELVAHLDKHKRYPAGRSRKSAEIMVSFALDRMGHVVSATIVKGSGDAAFDEAALAMLKRSDPVPPPPPLVADEGLNFSLPVIFRVKGKS
jgi:TonB family protein